MAVISVALKKPSRKGRQDAAYKRYYTRTLIVLTDDPHDDVVDLMQCPLIPKVGYSFLNESGKQDKQSFVQDLDYDEVGSDGMQWEVVVGYGPYGASQVFPENPIEWPLRIGWSFAAYDEIADEDANGQPVVNSAGDPFDPGVTRDDSRPVLQIVRNELYFDPALATQYKDALNSDPFFNCPPFTWKMFNITAQLRYDAATPNGFYYEVTYELQYRPETWIEMIADSGYFTRSGSTRKRIYVDGVPTPKPVHLDGSGGLLSPSAAPVYLPFHMYKEFPFATLQLDPSGAPGQAA